MNKDLTVGKPEKVLWAFCLPLFGSIIFQQLYNIADSLVAGKFIGENALAAVGNSYEITLIFIAFAFGCNIGCSVVVSRYFGAKLYADMKTAVHTTLIFSGAVCAVLMALGLIFQQPLLQLIKTPEDVLADSSLYLDIYIWGLPFVFFYNISEGIFSAMGDSKTPFIFLACSSLSNIAMDILFVTAFNMGVAGVAYATIISQILSAVLVIIVLMRSQEDYRLIPRELRINGPILSRILRIGLPAAIQTSVISFSNVFVQAYINEFQSSCMAGWTSYNRLDAFAWLPMLCLGMANTTFVGQNLGAGKLDRVKKGVNIGILIAMAGTLIIVVPLMCFSDTMLKLFNSDPEVLRYGRMFVLYMSPFYIPYCATQIYSGALRGAGDSLSPMIVTIASFVVFRQLYLLIGTQFISSPLFVGLSYPAGWIVSTITLFIIYRSGRWEKKLPAHVRMQAA